MPYPGALTPACHASKSAGITDAGYSQSSGSHLLKEVAECVCGYQNRPCRDCHDDGEEQRFNSELHRPFAGEIRSGKFAKRLARCRSSGARSADDGSLHCNRGHDRTDKAEARRVRLRIVKTRLRLSNERCSAPWRIETRCCRAFVPNAAASHRMEPAGERHRRVARRMSSLARANQTPYNFNHSPRFASAAQSRSSKLLTVRSRDASDIRSAKSCHHRPRPMPCSSRPSRHNCNK